MEVADGPEFLLDVAGFDFLWEGAECFRARVAGFERLRVKKAARIADDEAAVDVIARHGIPAAGGEGLRAVAAEVAAVEVLFDLRVRLPLLKSCVRIKLRVSVFESDDEADRDAIVRKAVDPAAAVHVAGDGPAERVRDIAGLDAAGRHVPH